MAQLAFFPVNNAPSRLHRRGKVSNWAIFYWKCPAENAGNGISETLNWNIFLREHAHRPPYIRSPSVLQRFFPVWVHVQNLTLRPWSRDTFPTQKVISCLQLIVQALASFEIDAKKIKIIESNCKIEPEFQFWVFKMLTGHSVPDRESFIAFRHKFRPPLFQLLIMRSVFLKCKGWVYMLN